MTDSLFDRMRRVVSNGVETAVEAVERASGSGLMREAVREVDRAIETLRSERDVLDTQRHDTERRRSAIRSEIAQLDEHARFAMSKDRRDLAEAAIARQIDLEAQLETIAVTDDGAIAAARRLDASIADLTARRAAMASDLAAAGVAHEVAARIADRNVSTEERMDRRATRARESFDRAAAMASSSAHATASSVDVATQIAAMKRLDGVQARLAALTGAPAAADRKSGRRRTKS